MNLFVFPSPGECVVPTVSTQLINTTEYPPVFDGSKTLRPTPKNILVCPPPPSAKENQALQFAPPVKTLKDLLSEAGMEAMDSMHVSTFEKLMISTHHNLLAIQPDFRAGDAKNASVSSPASTLLKLRNAAQPNNRCRQFLAVNNVRSTAICRSSFDKSREVDEAMCTLQYLVDAWTGFLLRMETTVGRDSTNRARARGH